MITNLPRCINKRVWKVIYRNHRIASREATKAFQDMIVFGTGMVEFKDGMPRHVPIDEVLLHEPRNHNPK